MLAKSLRSQSERPPPSPPLPTPRADRHYAPPPILSCGLSDAEGFDLNCLRQGRRKEHRDWGHHESMAWKATEAETLIVFFYKVFIIINFMQ